MDIQRITAIFEKDIKDFMKNMMLLVLPIIPIGMAFMFDQVSDELPLSLVYLIVGGTFGGVTASSMMTMMAEENENKTLRGLILSPVSLLDIIIGKSLVTGLLTFITLIVSLIIVSIEPFLNFRAIIGISLLFLFFLFLSIGIGLFSATIASTSGYVMTVMFLFGFTSMARLFGLEKDSLALKIIDLFPIMQAIKIHDTRSWVPILIITVWTIAALLFAYRCFRKVRTDD